MNENFEKKHRARVKNGKRPPNGHVHIRFLDFLAPFKLAQASGRRTTLGEFVAEARAGLRTLVKVAAISKTDPNKKVKRAMQRGSSRELFAAGSTEQRPAKRA